MFFFDTNINESTSSSISFSFESDLKNLLKVSLNNKRISFLIEQFENELREKDHTKKRVLRFRGVPKFDLSSNLKLDLISNIRYGTFGQSSLVHTNAFKRTDKKNYFFMKKLGILQKHSFVS